MNILITKCKYKGTYETLKLKMLQYIHKNTLIFTRSLYLMPDRYTQGFI